MTDQANNGAAAENEPQFSLQRIYVRDLSFEAPKSPAIFRQQWEPSVSLDLNTRQKGLEGDFVEVAFQCLLAGVQIQTDAWFPLLAEDRRAFRGFERQVTYVDALQGELRRFLLR